MAFARDRAMVPKGDREFRHLCIQVTHAMLRSLRMLGGGGVKTYGDMAISGARPLFRQTARRNDWLRTPKDFRSQKEVTSPKRASGNAMVVRVRDTTSGGREAFSKRRAMDFASSTRWYRSFMAALVVLPCTDMTAPNARQW